MISNHKHILLLNRTQIQCLAPVSDGLQSPIASAPGDLTPSSGLHWHMPSHEHNYTETNTDTCPQLKSTF